MMLYLHVTYEKFQEAETTGRCVIRYENNKSNKSAFGRKRRVVLAYIDPTCPSIKGTIAPVSMTDDEITVAFTADKKAKPAIDEGFVSFVKSRIADRLGCSADDVYCVWSCKTLQHIKGLFSSDVPAADGKYYEATYNGDKHELYLDDYDKAKNEAIKVEF